MVIVNRDCINHEDEIVTISYRQDLGLILTGGKDNKIKIWTTYKILMYEIVLDEKLLFCIWGSNMNIVLIQNLKLCCLRDIPLRLS
jgi:WD40 repeat protein